MGIICLLYQHVKQGLFWCYTLYMPQDTNEAIERAKGGIEILNEYRDTPAATASQSSDLMHSPLFLYSIYAVFFIIVSFTFLYIRYKRSL